MAVCETMGAGVLREARQGSGLSVRGLAASAGVAYSTVARIESGRLDPTTGMLARLLEAAGCRLELGAVRVSVPRLADLVDAWAVDALGQDRPDWTRLRGFLDHLAEHPRQVGVAVSAPPRNQCPHVSIRNAAGQRVDPYGNRVTRRSPGNHTPIIWDLS